MEIDEHYNHLLGIQAPWQISNVDLDIQEQRVDIDIEYADDVGPSLPRVWGDITKA